MGLKHHTIIFVPHSRARFRKWRITNRQLRVAVALLALITASAGFVTWSYFATSVNLDELARIKSENQRLRGVNDSFEQSVRELQSQLAEYEDRTKELAIVAGLDGLPASASERQTGSETGAGGGTLNESHPGVADLDLLAERTRQLDAQLGLVDQQLQERSRWISSTPAVMPVKGVFTSRYGYRNDPLTGRRAYHNGVDISAPKGRPVIATADGVVTRAGNIGSLGRAVYVSHGFGVSTRYGHLSKVAVEPGTRVKRGDVIGYVGNTGRSSGYHLHYEVRQDNESTDPLAFILDLPRRNRRS